MTIEIEAQNNISSITQNIVPKLPLFVSFTTLPSRIQNIKPTLDSLKAQTHVPDKVLLCLPHRSLGEGRSYVLPDWLGEYAPMLEIIDCEEDFGPGTKLMGSLDYITEPTCLVIVDDDVAYRPFFLEGLYSSQIREKDASFSYWTYQPGPFVVGQGVDGFSFYSPNLEGIKLFAKNALKSPHLFVQDDLWISAFLSSKGITVKCIGHLIPDNRRVYDVIHTINQLHNLDGELGRNSAIKNGTNYILEKGLLGKRHQLIAIMKKILRSARDALPQ